jgi:Tfp pilus assembly protein PilE
MAAGTRTQDETGDQPAMKMLPGTRFMRAAFSLVECLVYIALFFVVLGVALGAYYQMDEQSRGFARNSSDIVRTMQAGERWRADVRNATNAAQFEQNLELRLATRNGDVSYFFRDGVVWRQSTNESKSTPVLANVKSSLMKADPRSQVKAWRWEIELQSKRTKATVRPLFTFLAVPTTEASR